jgi:hypothetical protein
VSLCYCSEFARKEFKFGAEKCVVPYFSNCDFSWRELNTDVEDGLNWLFSFLLPSLLLSSYLFSVFYLLLSVLSCCLIFSYVLSPLLLSCLPLSSCLFCLLIRCMNPRSRGTSIRLLSTSVFKYVPTLAARCVCRHPVRGRHSRLGPDFWPFPGINSWVRHK